MVRNAALQALARPPRLPDSIKSAAPAQPPPAPPSEIWQAKVRDISGLGDRSVYGLPDETGVLVMEAPTGSPAAKAGLQKDDVIVSCNDQPVRNVNDLEKICNATAGKKLSITLIRKQKQLNVTL